MMGMDIKPMTLDDYDDVRALWEATNGVGLDASDERIRISSYLDRNPDLSLVAREEGRVVGVVMCGCDGRRGYLSHLAVDAAHRGRGLGRKLVESCLARLKTTGILRCTIHVYAENAEGTLFWEQIGFRTRPELQVMQIPTSDGEG